MGLQRGQVCLIFKVALQGLRVLAVPQALREQMQLDRVARQDPVGLQVRGVLGRQAPQDRQVHQGRQE